MIKKWEVSLAPSEKNSVRHKLLLNGEMKDIFLIFRKLGGICSRPEKAAAGYNFLIYLSKYDESVREKLKEVLEDLDTAADTPPRAVPADASFSINLVSGKPGVDGPPAPASPADIPAPEQKADAEPGLPSPEAPLRAAEIFSAGVPGTASAHHKEEPAPSAPAGNYMPSVSARMAKQAFAASEAEKAGQKAEQKTEQKAPAPVPAADNPNASFRTSQIRARWSMELPLIPTYSFQTLVAGSHNRFAHAAAMAVVENPGAIYNPLLIFGRPGTGKTHFVHSISYGLSAAIGQKNIFVTDGIKLSKGVEMAVQEGAAEKLEETFSKIKVLVIDDVHLLMISQTNKAFVAKMLNNFVTQNKQIVLTSVFPPKALAGLESTVGFQFTQGWMVDLKAPSAASYKTILTQFFNGMDAKLSEGEISNIFPPEKNMPFGEVVKSLENMKRLEKLTAASAEPVPHAKLLDSILGLSETAAGGVSEAELSKAESWVKPGTGAWFKWGVFYPAGMKREAQFALFRLYERASALGLGAGWTQMFMEEYNSDEAYGIPFKIGNYVTASGANGVIIIGPRPSSSLGAQETEFRHITFKILDSYLLKGAWIGCERLKSDAVYIKALMDLI